MIKETSVAENTQIYQIDAKTLIEGSAAKDQTVTKFTCQTGHNQGMTVIKGTTNRLENQSMINEKTQSHLDVKILMLDTVVTGKNVHLGMQKTESILLCPKVPDFNTQISITARMKPER